MYVLSTFGGDGSVFQLFNLVPGCIKLRIDSFFTKVLTNSFICLCEKSCKTMLLSFAFTAAQRQASCKQAACLTAIAALQHLATMLFSVL